MDQNHDALGVVCTCPTASMTINVSLSEEHLTYLLTCQEVTIGRGLNNDLILIDSTVSRTHAKLTLLSSGWHITNVSKKNTVYVNNQLIASDESFPVQTHDILTLGSTVLQFIDPDEKSPDVLKTSLSDGTSGHQPASPLWSGRYRNLLVASSGFAIFIVSIAVIIFANGLMRHPLLMRDGGATDLFVTLLIPPIPAAAIIALTHFINRFDPKPWFLRIAAFLWGACIAVPMAFFTEPYVGTVVQGVLAQGTNNVLHITFLALNPGVIEESSKGLGLLLLLTVRRNTVVTVVDGIVYGVLVGAGFALVENYWYFATHLEGSLATLILGRIFLGWLLHSTFTACIGVAFGHIRYKRGRWRQFGLLLTGFLLAVGLHSLFDFVVLLLDTSRIAFSGEGGSMLFSLLISIGNYIPPYIMQLVLVSLLVKALGTRTQRG